MAELVKVYIRSHDKWKLGRGPITGVLLALLLAAGSLALAALPGLGILGPMVLAIGLGAAWRHAAGVHPETQKGTAFASTTLLRAGIVLLGAQLSLQDVAAAGGGVLGFTALNAALALGAVYGIARVCGVPQRIALLAGVGTAICGAAAIAAVAPLVGAKRDETALGVITVALLGTAITIAYTLLQPVMGLDPARYGMLAGASLHELGHAVAAAAPFGREAQDAALLVKLTRVALLIPVSAVLALLCRPKGEAQRRFSIRTLPVPWFVFGFLAVSLFHSLGWISPLAAAAASKAAAFLLAAGMAGLGLNMNLPLLRVSGGRTLAATLLGSLILCAASYVEFVL
ncbi:YeiH family protein [Paenibacillus gansuensis]|uniref:YeiH family protein n=1 Tax=Paenibacillus gansuensis TaxID=306542 RepID=A0ABW5PGF8_9BACL